MWLPHLSQQQEGGRCDNPQLPKALWVQRHKPKVWARARRWHNSSSFVVERLTGEYVMDHHTANQSVPLYDLAAHRWHDAWYAEVIGDLSAPRLEWATNGAPRSRLGAGSGTGLTPLSAATSVSRFNPAETPGTNQPPPAGVGRPRRLGHHHPPRLPANGVRLRWLVAHGGCRADVVIEVEGWDGFINPDRPEWRAEPSPGE